MDEQQGGAQQDAPLQDSPLRRLWTRLRSREQVRPTWRHFALNAAVVPLLAAFQFFYATLRNSILPAAGGIDFVLFWGFPLCLIPASLLRAGWLWLRSGSWSGAVWLIRPGLLCLAFFVFFTPLRQRGKIWDFERHLAQRTQAVRILLSIHSAPIKENEAISVALPSGYQHLSKDGRVIIQGSSDGRQIVFPANSNAYMYSTSPRQHDQFSSSYYDTHWSILGW